MYAAYFEAARQVLVTASRPDEVLDGLDTLAPHVVVTDIWFRDSRLDGASFIREIRQRSWATRTAILVVSGYVRECDRQIVYAAGADRFFNTPMLPDVLLAEVRAALLNRE